MVEIRAEARLRKAALILRPKTSMSVAISSSQGRMASKILEGVNSSSTLPQSPPRTVASAIGKTGTSQTLPNPSR